MREELIWTADSDFTSAKTFSTQTTVGRSIMANWRVHHLNKIQIIVWKRSTIYVDSDLVYAWNTFQNKQMKSLFVTSWHGAEGSLSVKAGFFMWPQIMSAHREHHEQTLDPSTMIEFHQGLVFTLQDLPAPIRASTHNGIYWPASCWCCRHAARPVTLLSNLFIGWIHQEQRCIYYLTCKDTF